MAVRKIILSALFGLHSNWVPLLSCWADESSYLSAIIWRWAGHVARMGEERGCIGSCWGNWREEDHWGDLDVDGWIILERISRKWDVGIWTGLGWPRIETGGGRL